MRGRACHPEPIGLFMQGRTGAAVTWLPVRLRRICSTSRAGVHTRIPAGVSRLPGDAGHLATGTFSGGHLPHSSIVAMSLEPQLFGHGQHQRQC